MPFNKPLRPTRLAGRVAAAALALAVAAGCQSARVPQQPLASQIKPAEGNTPASQIEFWHALSDRHLASNDDAFHALLLYFDTKDDAADYNARVQALKARKWLANDFSEPADASVTRGTVAAALCRALNFKGGITMALLGPSPRYALRELQYRNLLPDSSPNQGFTGAELVGVIGKIEDLRTGNPADVPAEQLPEERRLAAGGKVTPDSPQIVLLPPDYSPEPDLTPDLQLATDPNQLTLTTPVYAMILQDPTSGPAPDVPADLKATIAKVQGTVEFRPNDQAKWEPLTVGKTLAPDASIRTGARGAVVLTVPPDQTISVDRLTTMTVLKAYQNRGKVTTDVGMKYGRVRYDIAGAGVEHEASIRSPNSNLAIRGTKVSLFDQRPYTPEAVSLTGRAQFSTIARRGVVAFGKAGQGKTVIRSGDANPASFALAQSVVDPGVSGARTNSEEALINTLISRGATVSFDQDAGIRVVRGGGAPSDAQLANSLPGMLNFVVRWDGSANLDLALSTPNFPDGHAEFIYPIGGLDRSKSGGVIPFDHRGGKGGGIEVVYWPANTFTSGTYALSVQRVSGAQSVNATIEAFLGKTPLSLDPDAQVPVTQVKKIVSTETGAVQFVSVPTQIPDSNGGNGGNGGKDGRNNSDGTIIDDDGTVIDPNGNIISGTGKPGVTRSTVTSSRRARAAAAAAAPPTVRTRRTR
jgi:hypothetical protein